MLLRSKKTHPTKRKRTLYTPEPLQHRIIALHINGESDHEIGKKAGIHRSTVKRIRSRPEVLKIIAEQKNRVLLMTPKAMDVYLGTLEALDPKLKFVAATNILKSAGVIEQGSGNAKNGHFTLTKSDWELEHERRINRLAMGRLSMEDLYALRENLGSDCPGVPSNEREKKALTAYESAVAAVKLIQDKS